MGLITIKNAHPISGIEWDNGLSWRFPVKEVSGEYIHIVFDVKENQRAWLRMKTVPVDKNSDRNKQFNTIFYDDQKCNSELILFDHLGESPLPVDIHSLLKDTPRKFYETADKDSNRVTDINSYRRKLAKTARDRGYLNSAGFYISEIQNGYAKITDGFYNETIEFIYLKIGWIRLYDNDECLTVWYQYRQIP